MSELNPELDPIQAMLTFTALLERVDGRMVGLEQQIREQGQQLKEQVAQNDRALRTWARLQRQLHELTQMTSSNKKKSTWP